MEHTKQILIVDDYLAMTELTACSLTLLNKYYTIDQTTKSEEAIHKIKETAYDLLITDYHMPIINGLELAQYVRQVLPKTKIVLMSSDLSYTLRTKAESMGLNACLSKPFSIEELQTVVKRLLRSNNVTMSFV